LALLLVLSLSQVNWEIFDRVTNAYQSQYFPTGSFGEWAGRRLLVERKAMRCAQEKIQVHRNSTNC
jgi:hypothetical protein